MNSFTSGYKTYDTDRDGYGSAWEWKRAFHKRMSREEADEILDEDDPFVILGVGVRVTRNELKKAYRTLAMKWHPDRNPNNIDQATEKMKKINAAYDSLCWRFGY